MQDIVLKYFNIFENIFNVHIYSIIGVCDLLMRINNL